MAHLSPFGYLPGDSFLHRRDVRFKLASSLMSVTALAAAQPAGLALFALGLAALAYASGLRAARFARELRYLGVFLLLVLVSRSLTEPGDPLWRWGGVTATREGLTAGALVVLRLILLAGTGLLFVATTRHTAIRAGIQWLLAPVPGVPQARVALMVGLMVRYLPQLHDILLRHGEALRARDGGRRLPPGRYLRHLALPVVRRTLLSADQLAVALAARGWPGERGAPVFAARRGDWALLVGTLALASGALAAGRLWPGWG